MIPRWNYVRLGDICETGAGGTPLKSHSEYYSAGTIPWLLSGEVNRKEILEVKHFITEAGFRNSSAKLFPKNTVVIAMYGATAGQVGILQIESTTNQAVCGILPNSVFTPDFLYYFFLSKKEELVAQAVGNAQPNISQLKIRNTMIPLPPLDEQKRIVAMLDEAFIAIDKARENTERNIRNVKELFDSYLEGIFANPGEGWEEKTLGELFVIERGGSPRPIEKYLTKAEDGINWIKIGDTKNTTKYIYSTAEKIKPEGMRKSRLVKPGDFILSNSMSFGRPYIMKTTGCIHDGWLVIRPGQTAVDQDYLFYVLSSKPVFRQFDSLAAGSTVRNLNIDLVKRVVIQLPPLQVQKALALKIEEISIGIKKLETIYYRKQNILIDLKNAILSKAFYGE